MLKPWNHIYTRIKRGNEGHPPLSRASNVPRISYKKIIGFWLKVGDPKLPRFTQSLVPYLKKSQNCPVLRKKKSKIPQKIRDRDRMRECVMLERIGAANGGGDENKNLRHVQQ